MGGATTPKLRTACSMTASGSAGPIPWVPSATCSTGSATVSWSTPWPVAAPASLGHRGRGPKRPDQEVEADDLGSSAYDQALVGPQWR